MKQLGLVSFNHGSRIRRILIDRPTVDLRPAPAKERDSGGVSPALDGHLRAWWGGVRAARKLCCGALERDFDWLGDNPDWPEWVHVGALSQLAGRTYHKAISNRDFARWMAQNQFERKTKMVHRKNNRGRVTYQTTRTFYKIG